MGDLKKTEEAEKAKLEEELRRKSALAAIMKALQNMRCATPESFEELKQKLSVIYAQELRHTKQDLQALIYEKEKAIEAASKNVEQASTEHCPDLGASSASRVCEKNCVLRERPLQAKSCATNEAIC